MITYSIRINSNGHDFHFHTESVDKLRKLFADTRRMGALHGFTIWAGTEELNNQEQARLAFGTLPFNR